MGDRDDYKSKKYKSKSRKRKRDYDDDDDDDYKRRDRYNYDRDEKRAPKKTLIERLLTPGQTANNLIKTAATGMIAGGTILLMGIYGLFGENIAGANSYLPMATAVTSAVATACIWIFGRPKIEETHNAEFNQIKKELRRLNIDLQQLEIENTDLEQRLANVEMLESFENKLAKRTIEKQIKSESPITIPTGPKSALGSNISTHNEDSSQTSSSLPLETE